MAAKSELSGASKKRQRTVTYLRTTRFTFPSTFFLSVAAFHTFQSRPVSILSTARFENIPFKGEPRRTRFIPVNGLDETDGTADWRCYEDRLIATCPLSFLLPKQPTLSDAFSRKDEEIARESIAFSKEIANRMARFPCTFLTADSSKPLPNLHTITCNSGSSANLYMPKYLHGQRYRNNFYKYRTISR